jgi:hypothetical protein
MLETERGYALISADALSGAPTIKAGDLIQNEIGKIRTGKAIDWNAIGREIGIEIDDDEDDE